MEHSDLNLRRGGQEAKPYRGRLAPSPTGYLHAGHARTFWIAYDRAREVEGALVLRMEDLDPDRSRAVYSEAALEDLRWLGVHWDEGPDVGGRFVPYVQSQRIALYEAAFERLREAGYLYPCRCSRKDLAAALRAPHEGVAANDAAEDEPIYPGTCRPGTWRPDAEKAERSGSMPVSAAGFGDRVPTERMEAPANWRFRVPDGDAIEFIDLNLGPQRFVAGKDFGDFVVMRRDLVPQSKGKAARARGMASYQLACVVDDAAMQITEVVRGADLLKSTARQILLNRALGYTDPAWFHCNLVVNERGQRLAKRYDSLSIRTLREQRLTPQQVLTLHAGAL